MNNIAALLCAALSVFSAAGCLASDGDGPKSNVEVVDVSKQLSGKASYNVDLTRVDTIFYLPPPVDAARVTVTCPTGPVFSFTSYIDLRVRPTGRPYDPATTALYLANGAIPETALKPVVPVFAATGSAEADAVLCTDDSKGVENCGGFPIKE